MVHTVEGYVICISCQDALVIAPVANRTGNLCLDCLEDRGEPFREIEIEARGARIPIKLTRQRRTRSPKSSDAKAREKIVDKCKLKAMRRLRAIFPDLYDILLAQERAAVGLDPWPLGSALNHGPDPDGSQTEAFARLYHALGERGEDV